MPPKPLGRGEIADLTQSLSGLLDAIRQDEVTASTATVYRMEGAVTALEAVLGASSSSLAHDLTESEGTT